MRSLIIILVFLELHQHSAGCFNIVNLPRCDLIWWLKSCLMVVIIETTRCCHTHLLLWLISKVRRSSNLLTLLVLNHHVADHSELLGLWWSKNSTALSNYHLWVVVLLTNFAWLEECVMWLLFIFDKYFIFLEFGIAGSEYIIDVLWWKLTGNLGVYGLFFLTILLEHRIKQCIHALRLI